MKAAARWAPISGVLFVALWIVAFFLFGDESGESDGEIVSFYADSGNRTRQVAAYFVVLAAGLAFIWFLSILRGRMADAEGKVGSTTALAFGAGLVASVFWTLAAIFWMAISFAADDSDVFVVDPNTTRVVDNMGYAIWISGTTVALLVVLATGLVGLRTGFLPKWLAWVSFVVALTMIASFAFVPFLIFLGWMLVVSILLLWKPMTNDAPVAAPSS